MVLANEGVTEDVTAGVAEGVETTTNFIQTLTHQFVPTFAQGFVDDALNILIPIVVGIIIAKLVLKVANQMLNRMNVEMTLHKFIKSILRIVVYFVVVLVVAQNLGFNTTSILALASVLSAAFALAAQDSLSNLFGGILLLMTKPFLVGDYVSAGGVEGTVLEIGLLNTLINTIDNKRISVPNSTISAATITNYSTEGNRRVDLKITASYDNSIDSTKAALMDAIQGTANIIQEPIAPFVRVWEYGESSITYIIRVWCTNDSYWSVYFDLMENIKYSFDRNGIEMTYNHLNVHMMKD